MRIVLQRFPYRFFRYEERFLVHEARSLGRILHVQDGRVVIAADGSVGLRNLKERLQNMTYFSHFTFEGQSQQPTRQFLLEMASNGHASAGRQSTRYSTHGIHEYKGKFNPQIARHLMNRGTLSRDAAVFDPFCGSGTVLIEAYHYGCHAVGIDSNPLCELIANAKLTLLRGTAGGLNTFGTQVKAILDDISHKSSRGAGYECAQELGITPESFDYLCSWFPPERLGELLEFRLRVRKQLSPAWAKVADTLVSSIARTVSYQDPADLRIRRRKTAVPQVCVAELLSSSLEILIERTRRTLPLISAKRGRFVRAYCGDSRSCCAMVRRALEKVGARPSIHLIITSPPYATALPYVDTSRLSLVILGLAQPKDLRGFEHQQIGNRELPESVRKKVEEELDGYLVDLPVELSAFILDLLRLVRSTDVGFRRRNIPVLLAQYFVSIKQVLEETRALLAKKGLAFWIVGKNRTHIDGRSIEVDTPRWIACLARSAGFEAGIETLDTYQRFGLHQRNSIRDESLLIFSGG